jgi:phosphatidylethanolamine/phosphatidyl-N-methylethanolamine N-methyltransferase
MSRVARPNTLGTTAHFIWAGVFKYGQTGAIVPSQRFLIAKMIAPVPKTYTGQIIELGAGNGALTLRLAERCLGARILACEINPNLARDLRYNLTKAGINGRVEVIADSAEHLLLEMRRSGIAKADYVISGIPIGNLGRKHTLAFIDTINKSLAEHGMYIQFQHSLLDRKKIGASFSNVRTIPVLLNFPPAVIYYAQK